MVRDPASSLTLASACFSGVLLISSGSGFCTLPWAVSLQLFTLPPDEGSPLQVTYTGILEMEDVFDLSLAPNVEQFQLVTFQFLGEDTALLRFTSARREDLQPFENSYSNPT